MEFDGNNVRQTANEQMMVAEAANMTNQGASSFTPIQLSFSCSDLINMDIGSLSDPFVSVKMKNNDRTWREIQRTEIVANSLNPKWVKLIAVDFLFEEAQMMRFEVYDVAGDFSNNETAALNLREQNQIGYAECHLALIVGNTNSVWTAKLNPFSNRKQNRELGSITVRAEKVPFHNVYVSMHFCMQNLPKIKNRFSFSKKPSPFILISRLLENREYIPCHRTNVKMKTTSPIWKPFLVPMTEISAGDEFRPLKIEVFSWQKSGKHVLLGQTNASADDLINKSGSSIPMKNMRGECYNDLIINECKKEEVPNFFDYLNGGMELQFMCAIDFTQSNGPSSSKESLHYFDPYGSLNPYSKAISEVGKILEYYDSDKKFPVYGFGGKPTAGSAVKHCFPVNYDPYNDEVEGVDGILSAYYECLQKVELDGPTLFAPVINKAATVAASYKNLNSNKLKYCVLLIITDGCIHDMANTKDAIVTAAELPFSIIIIGVGKENFESMEILDGDNERVRNSFGKKAVRDIVQFVPMRDFIESGSHAFTKEVLQELPGAVVEYYRMNNIQPFKNKVAAAAPPFGLQHQFQR